MLSSWARGSRAPLLGAALCALLGTTSCALGAADGLRERVLADADHGYSPSLALLGDYVFVAQYEGADDSRLTLLRTPFLGGKVEHTIVGLGLGPLVAANRHQIGLAYLSQSPDRRVHFARLDDQGKPISQSDRSMELAGTEHILDGLAWNASGREWALVFEDLFENRWHLHLARLSVDGAIVSDQDLGETCDGAPSDAVWDGARYVVLKTCMVPDSKSTEKVFVPELQMWTSDTKLGAPPTLDRGSTGRPRLVGTARGLLAVYPAALRLDGKAIEVRSIMLSGGQWSAPIAIPTAPFDTAAFDAAGSSAGVAVVLALHVPGGQEARLLRLTDRGERRDEKSLGTFVDYNASFDVGWAANRALVVHTEGDSNAAHELVMIEP